MVAPVFIVICCHALSSGEEQAALFPVGVACSGHDEGIDGEGEANQEVTPKRRCG